MKKLVSLIILLLIIILPSCTAEKQDDSSKKEQNPANTVIVHNAEIFDDYAVLPLCEVLDSLGFCLEWNGNDRATFVCNEIEYEILISDRTLTKIGDDDNYLICAPGNDHFVCDVSNGDLMVDDNTVGCLFRTFLKYPARISIDRNNNCVMIVKQ